MNRDMDWWLTTGDCTVRFRSFVLLPHRRERVRGGGAGFYTSPVTVVALVIAYLLGSIDFGVIVPRVQGIDIYAQGSGNPGTSNVYRTLGKKAAAVVMLGDALKGLAAAAVGSALVDPTVGAAAGLAAVIGHVAPLWHRFRGGRGVATAIGAAMWLVPLWGVLLALGWAVTVALTKTASIASLVAMALYVPVYVIGGAQGWSLVFAAAAAGLVVWRHKDNIGRILAGAERRLETS